MFKVSNKTPGRRHWRCSCVFIVNFEHISHIFPVSIFNFEQVNVSAKKGINQSTQPTIIYSKLTIQRLEEGVKYVQKLTQS